MNQIEEIFRKGGKGKTRSPTTLMTLSTSNPSEGSAMETQWWLEVSTQGAQWLALVTLWAVVERINVGGWWRGSLWVDGGEDRCKGQRCRENGCSHLEQHQWLQWQGATLVMREERKGFGEKGLDVWRQKIEKGRCRVGGEVSGEKGLWIEKRERSLVGKDLECFLFSKCLCLFLKKIMDRDITIAYQQDITVVRNNFFYCYIMFTINLGLIDKVLHTIFLLLLFFLFLSSLNLFYSL